MYGICVEYMYVTINDHQMTQMELSGHVLESIRLTGKLHHAIRNLQAPHVAPW